MKKIYLIRHAEKDSKGVLSERGRADSIKLGDSLPKFDAIYSSGSNRTQESARLITGKNPEIDDRAGFYMAPDEKSDAINKIYKEQGIDFLEAVYVHNDNEVLRGISDQADRLNGMIDELLKPPGENVLIVSHNLTMIPAIKKRGFDTGLLLDYLGGYIIDESGKIENFSNKF